MNFVKMHGIGNDFIFIENFDKKLKEVNELARKVCHRHFGIGADGLVLVQKSKDNIMEMVIINSDGSNANMCGNAIRCFGKYVYEKGYVKDSKFPVLTGDGMKEIEVILEDSVVTGAKVYMGKPSYKGEDIGLSDNLKEVIKEKVIINDKSYELTSVLVGVPHTIIIGDEEQYDVLEGEFIERYDFYKNGSNVNFVTVYDKENAKVRTWERGAGVTLACGTGACASVAILNKFNLTGNKVNVTLPGGKLLIEVEDDGIFMSGNAEYICEGKLI